jgi:hypothetical protein
MHSARAGIDANILSGDDTITFGVAGTFALVLMALATTRRSVATSTSRTT